MEMKGSHLEASTHRCRRMRPAGWIPFPPDSPLVVGERRVVVVWVSIWTLGAIEHAGPEVKLSTSDPYLISPHAMAPLSTPTPSVSDQLFVAYVPCAHCVHDIAPLTLLVRPAEHAVQSLSLTAPAIARKVPTGHRLHLPKHEWHPSISSHIASK